MGETNLHATVVGAGLAGSEAAWQLACRGIQVTLVEGKPQVHSPVHHLADFAELVCSNSLRSNQLENAVGLLKEELRQLGSLILKAADATAVPAGGALAVDREGFSRYVTQALTSHPLVQVVREEAVEIPDGPCIIATGPLTEGRMAEAIARLIGDASLLHFHDAVAPIVRGDSINMDVAFAASRYGRGEADYINCPMNEAEYHAFVRELLAAERAPLHEFEEDIKVFESCMPVESMAERGPMTLAYGPLKPVGLVDRRTGKRPFAVVQLRQDDAAGSLYNMVGFQTRLKFPEQRRVFRMIPGLERAQFERYGVMHRNTYLHSPGFLDGHYRCLKRENLYFAGQMTGVEGYVESAGSGFVAGVSLARQLLGERPLDFTRRTMLGAMAAYVSNPAIERLEPMNATFGLLEEFPHRVKKAQRKEAWTDRALLAVDVLSGPLLEDVLHCEN